jgi:hypothetical protein
MHITLSPSGIGPIWPLIRALPLKVEVNNTQAYSFDRAHSMWRYILLPQGDLRLPVLTRLTLSRDGSKVRLPGQWCTFIHGLLLVALPLRIHLA